MLLLFGAGHAAWGQSSRDTSWLKWGGAVRFNTMYTIYEGETFDLPTENRNGLFWDMFRLQAAGSARGLGFDFEYRFYPGFNAHFIKKGYLTYAFSETLDLQVGITQVPFGMLEFLGNSWWFQLPYYVGLEDDYDTGLKVGWSAGDWQFHAAYFLMAEPRGVSDLSLGSFMSARYSYDVIPLDGYNGNKERNQGNVRAAFERGPLEGGLSGQIGEIHNSRTGRSSWHWAGALHAAYDLNPQMNIKFQATHFAYPNATDDLGNETGHVNMGAYGFGTYEVAAEASILSLGLAYRRELAWGPLSGMNLYGDYSYMHKYGSLAINGSEEPFVDTHHLILGFSLEAGNLLAYFDIASGINQPWLSDAFGGSALSSGRGADVYTPPGEVPEDRTDTEANPLDRSPPLNTRFNINLGYYLFQ